MERWSLVLTQPRTLEWVPETLSPPGQGELLVRTTSGAISIGTELPQYTGAERVIVARGYPRVTGYESVGVIVARGEDVDSLMPGERVIAFYGHRTAAIIPARQAIPVPSEVPDALALLAILSCDAAKGVRKLAPGADAATLITGAGVMGLLTLFVLQAYGVREVDVIEPREERRALALRMGARQAMTPEQAQQRKERYAIGFECSSRQPAFALLQDKMETGARLCMLADGNIEPLTLAPAFHAHELSVIASSDGWDYQRHAEWYFERALASRDILEALYEVQTDAAHLPATFAQMASAALPPLKALVRYPAGALSASAFTLW